LFFEAAVAAVVDRRFVLLVEILDISVSTNANADDEDVMCKRSMEYVITIILGV
jgi:hypothetical protein